MDFKDRLARIAADNEVARRKREEAEAEARRKRDAEAEDRARLLVQFIDPVFLQAEADLRAAGYEAGFSKAAIGRTLAVADNRKRDHRLSAVAMPSGSLKISVTHWGGEAVEPAVMTEQQLSLEAITSVVETFLEASLRDPEK